MHTSGFKELVHVALHFSCPSSIHFTIVSLVGTLEIILINLLNFAWCVFFFCSYTQCEEKRGKE